MSEKVIAIYCFLEDFFQEMNKGAGSPHKVSDAAILTAALIAARYFYGNQATARQYLQTHYGLDLLDKSGFNHRLQTVLEGLFYYLADFFKSLNLSSEYVLDSFPVAICDNIRIRRSRLVSGEEYRGKIASKRRFFYGFRVQVIATIDGLPVQYLIHPGAFVDVTALQAMQVNLPANSHLYADSGGRPAATPIMNRKTTTPSVSKFTCKSNARRIANARMLPMWPFSKKPCGKRLNKSLVR